MPKATGSAKFCPKCQRVLPLNEFYKDAGRLGNLTSWCKTCCKLSKRAWRLNNKDKIREISRHYLNCVPRGKYLCYRKSAKRTGRSFTLTFEEFLTFWKKPCHYCHGTVKTVGLDRVKNAGGYSFNNVVSCCKMCNFMKRGYSAGIFLKQCFKIMNTQRSTK